MVSLHPNRETIRECHVIICVISIVSHVLLHNFKQQPPYMSESMAQLATPKDNVYFVCALTSGCAIGCTAGLCIDIWLCYRLHGRINHAV